MVWQFGEELEIPEEFRQRSHGHWMPADHRVQHEWLRQTVACVDREHAARGRRAELAPALAELKTFIETTPRVFMYFTAMWDEVPHRALYRHDPTGHRQIRDYGHMLDVLNHVFSRAPEWTNAAESVGMVGVPLCAVFDYAMGTPSGHAAFLDPDVNRMLKKVLNAWGQYLTTPDSARVLGDHDAGWFGRVGMSDLMAVANAPYQTTHRFEDMYVCDPTAKYYGYKSWDEARPVASPDDDSVINNACESCTFGVRRGAKLRDRFWIKGQPYSVLDMLAHDPLANQFEGATVYQAFLSALSYHRWHAPVSGTVRRAFVQDGTYFSEPLFEGVGDPSNVLRANLGGHDHDHHDHDHHDHDHHDHHDHDHDHHGEHTADAHEHHDHHDHHHDHHGTSKPEDGPIDVKGITQAQGYLTALATRAVIFFEADNPDIGLMAFIGVGMDEVSTCDIGVREGQHVRKGDEIGMFHFGGSSHVLLFRPGVAIEGFPQPGRTSNVPVRSALARVPPSGAAGRK